MDNIIFIGDIVEENGKTVKENNLEKKHNIPIGSLVEVKSSEWYGDGACERWEARLWVVNHSRDCDGTQLYILGRDKDNEICKRYGYSRGGFSEESLKVIEVTPELIYGEGALEWEEE